MKYKLFLFLLASCYTSVCVAQQASYFDPAQAYNRLLIEKNNGTYTRVSRYKVIGSSYLFGEKHSGHLFAKGETAYNIKLSYNTHSQEIEFYSSANPDKSLIKEANQVDSFTIKANVELNILEPLRFVNGMHVGQANKSFYQVVYSGTKYNLYKAYRSDLGIVSTNYVDADLRQFEIQYDYYYQDLDKKEFKKLKVNQASIKKEFKGNKDVEAILSDNSFSFNPEVKLIQIFASLNK